ncbi:ion transporter [Candidatus Uabimicrobium amorphum]|uniref:Ion transporter n=1 Tax=Uabimicrobium amorphum TaxID=2596890 RepID=A0A5S9F301_UABAM|nr:ion transporter [Candidatus Uabimicrobium amorphum]BBM83978.1 ion transporter [Candidatus Uabimicrobium amorphum]
MSESQKNTWRSKMHEVIYEADTPLGKWFDIFLLVAIVASVAVVMLESIKSFRADHAELLFRLEWAFTIFFSIEYIARIICVGKPFRYIFSFMGLVDLLSILPTYIGLFVTGTQSLLVIRTIRLLRIFRIFKIARYLSEAQTLMKALKASRPKITVFMGAVISLVIIMGTFMYMIEGDAHGFTSIPKSVYWAIVTLTTVGYGDIAPQTPLGQTLASMIMIMGYAIIAVPTGIVSVELSNVQQDKKITTRVCAECSQEGHDDDAVHCKYCGAKL